jgi:radical SAM superfamily enzyme YgiQ (UPF0313 family)
MRADIVDLPALGSKRAEKRVLLVHSPIDSASYADARQHYAPSAGLIALQTFLGKRCANTRVDLLDGALLPKAAIIDAIRRQRPNVVGQSVQQLSYANALDIARVAKEVGALSVFGGQHATQLAGEIVANQHTIVDAVIRHDGEIPLALICQGVPIAQIANATYWADGVHHNAAVEWNLDMYPAPEYGGVDLTPYIDCYTSRLSFGTPHTFLRTHSHRGCGNRNGTHACDFCGRADIAVRFKTPGKFVDELGELRQRWGADAVFDTGDDIAYSVPWLREVAERVEASGLLLELGCFGRACRLRDPEVAHLLKRIGVTNIIIGFESGDPDLLRRCGKGGVTPEDNLLAAANLFDNGIDVCASYVIGLAGESEVSLRKTFENAQRLLDLALKRLGRKPYELVANFFEPSPGSPAFRRLKQAYPEKYEGTDMIDLEEAQADYFRIHWNLPSESSVSEFRSWLVEWGRRLNSLTVEADHQGFRKDEVRAQVENRVADGGMAA